MPNIRIFKSLTLQIALVLTVAAVASGQEVKKVSKAEAIRAAVSRVPPDYPAAARQLKIQGDVELNVVIGEGGTVEKVDIVSGNPMLTRPAADALRKWKFTPFTEGGKAVKASAPLTVTFKL